MLNKIILFFFVFNNFFASNAESCSTFLLEKSDQILLAKSYDWIIEDGLIMVNKRHIAKVAMTKDSPMPMQWISKYGSIIFTQAGRELPMGGMNETGLAIELMWLDDTAYPMPDSRSTVYDLQWIQYQLDTAENIEEVVASNQILRIDNDSKSLVHFIIVDNTGNRAIIEFINGEMVVHSRNELLLPVLTNNSYQESLEY
nr:linear amide C-N hydrolase [Parachlamydiaceae bacterium]